LSSEQVHAYVDQLAKALELLGVAIIVGGIALATWKYVRDSIRGGDWQSVYPSYRSNIGRGILLGLELSARTLLQRLPPRLRSRVSGCWLQSC
jgi:hypothetical protein